MQIALTILLVLIVALIILVLLAPRLGLGPKLGKLMGDAYQKRLFNQIKKKYPLLAERLATFEMTPENQQALQGAMSKLPPQEGMKLMAEFNRLRDKFLERHPEIAPLLEAGQDAKAQSKAFDALMKLPDDKRQALEKDLLWAWDQLRGRFPKLVGQLEARLKKAPAATK